MTGRQVSAAAGSGRRRWWLGIGTTGVVLIAAAFWAGTMVTSSASLQAQLHPAPRTSLTAPVIWRRLTETLTVSGTVAATAAFRVNFGPVTVAGAQPIVTARPPRAGSDITDDSVLAEVAGRPVFAMLGTTPMYRDLTVGDQGRDVLQLQQGLATAGFTSADTPGVFGAATEAAVRAFYRATGYAAPHTVAGSAWHLPP
jgi:HlyD family secretion protein